MDGNGLAAALQAFCMKRVECFGYALEVCVDYRNPLIAALDLTPVCEAAITSYFNCGAALSCSEVGEYNNSCSDEYYSYVDVCLPKM